MRVCLRSVVAYFCMPDLLLHLLYSKTFARMTHSSGLCRVKLKALVRDPQAAKLAFGPYVTFVQGDTGLAAHSRRSQLKCI